LITHPETNVRLLLDQLWLELLRFEKAASRFLSSSELTQLNRYGAIKHSLTSQMHDALISAQRSADLSGGLFNPFVLPAVQKTGYLYSVTDPKRTVVGDFRKRRIADISELEVGDTWAKIPPGTALDLGGCGKGHIVDVLAGIARKNSAVRGGWIEASGDIYAWGHDVNRELLTIAVQSAIHDTKALRITIPESGLGVATSGTFARENLTYSKDTHHIIDPRTSLPATSDISLATVCASSGLEADVLASSAIIMGFDQAPAYLHDHGATGWVLQPDMARGNNKPAKIEGSHFSSAAAGVSHV
jgi:thiamine biosynthesis lipoprotein